MWKVLHTSDWHPDWVTSGVRRFDEIEEAVWETVEAAKVEKVALYAFTGDLCDPNDGAMALRCAKLAIEVVTELARVHIPSAFLTGNHDPTEDVAGTTSLTPLVGIRGLDGFVHVFEQPGVVHMPGGLVVALPYPPLSRAYDPVKEIRGLLKNRHKREPVVVLTHLQFSGIVKGEESTDMARGRDVPFPHEECQPDWLILGGHYHNRQTWESGRGVRAHFAGSLARLTHGEERTEPSYQIFEVP